MGRRLQGWLALPRTERATLSLMLAGLPLVWLGLLVAGYKRTRALIEKVSRHPQPRDAGAADLLDAERVAQLAAVAGIHGLVRATCLPRALAVYGVLRRRGLQPELKLGVRRKDQEIEAHAWVELEGQPLAQPNLDYAPFGEPPAASR